MNLTDRERISMVRELVIQLFGQCPDRPVDLPLESIASRGPALEIVLRDLTAAVTGPNHSLVDAVRLIAEMEVTLNELKLQLGVSLASDGAYNSLITGFLGEPSHAVEHVLQEAYPQDTLKFRR